MTFDSTQVVRIDAANISSAYLTDELGYFSSFNRHIEVINHLKATGTCFREAHSQYLYAIELFFKDVFCTLRFNSVGAFTAATIKTAGKGLPETVRSKMIASLKAFSYGHNLRKLAKCLQEFCPNLASDADFLMLVTLLPADDKWPEQRYDDPASHSKTDYKVSFEKLEGAFTNVRERSFMGFK